jgi:hypothetical protein
MSSLQSTQLLTDSSFLSPNDIDERDVGNELTRELSDVASRFNPESSLKPKVLRVNLVAFPQLFPKTRKSDTTNINKYPIRILHNKGVE